MTQQATNGHINADAVRLGASARRQVEDAPPININLGDLTALTIRLARILAEEVDLLDEMKIKELEPLQEEKNRLTRVIGAMKKELERSPDAMANFDPEDVEAFQQVAAVFGTVLEENRRRLLVAKEINHSVVQAISDVVREEALRGGYDRKGGNGTNRAMSPSVSLNEKI